MNSFTYRDCVNKEVIYFGITFSCKLIIKIRHRRVYRDISIFNQILYVSVQCYTLMYS